MKIAIQTLGCKVNQSESASIEGVLRAHNFEIVKHTDNPDICIVNTCTVTAKSDYQSRQLIRKAAKSGARVIAAGCYAQLRPEAISRIEGLDLVIGNSGKNDILNYIQNVNRHNAGLQVIIEQPLSPLTAQPYYSSRSRAFLKIQDGCNFSCSYCTVPLARGKSRSLSTDDVLETAGQLFSAGYRETVLTGIHIGSYGLDLQPQSSLLHIVEMLIRDFPQVRIRLSSLEPQEFKEEFLSFVKEGSVCGHLHIPLQSGSDKILMAMNRGYTTAYFNRLIENIRSFCPDISIGTDIITGFPGETESDFLETVKFIDQLPFSYLHVFPYSKRPDTRAALLDNQLTDNIKQERVRVLLEISKSKKILFMKSKLGNVLDVIVENKSVTTGYYTGLSDDYLKISIKSDSLTRGERIKVKVISLTDSGLISEPLHK